METTDKKSQRPTEAAPQPVQPGYGESHPAEEEIDLLELARKLWAERRMIIRWCIIAAVIGLVVGFSIPKEYTTTVKLAPEISDGKSVSGGLGALASMAGINLSGGSGADAVYPELYPDIVASVPFLVHLFDVEVQDKKGELTTTTYEYLNDHTKSPWWSAVIQLPFRVLGWTLSLFRDEDEGEAIRNTFRLTKEESETAKALSERINIMVDKKTSVVTLSVTMQDPLISATLTDSVMRNLQQYVTEYRTDKARNDLEFTQHLFDESQANYYNAQERYARYMDANQNIVLRSVRTEQERLQNEMNLAYNVYTQMAQQLQLAKAKVQEATPVYAVVQPATVPLKPSSTSKLMILLGFIFLGGAAAAGWILFGRDLLRSFREQEA